MVVSPFFAPPESLGLNPVQNCDSSIQFASCFCASSIGSQLQQCMDCIVSNAPSVQSEAQAELDSWNQECSGKLSVSSHACVLHIVQVVDGFPLCH